MRGRPLAAGALAACVVAVAGCSGTGSSAARSTTTAPGAAPGAAPTTSASPPSSGTAPVSTTAPLPAGAQDLVVSDAVRAQLLAAGAAMNSLPLDAYTGLVPGTTYYAYDTATSTYWAGAGLVPSPSSQQAQVSVQDDGGYVLFDRAAGGTWQARPDGLGGVGGTPCPSDLPASVVAAWGWAPGTCRPPQ